MMCEVGTYWARFNTRVYASRILSCVVKLVDKIRALTMGVISSRELHTDISKKVTTQINTLELIAWHNMIRMLEWRASMFKCCKRDNSCIGNNSYEGSNIVLGCCVA